MEVKEVQFVVLHLQVVVLKGLVGADAQLFIVQIQVVLEKKHKFTIFSVPKSYKSYNIKLTSYIIYLYIHLTKQFLPVKFYNHDPQ